jgi:hypothetical protein
MRRLPHQGRPEKESPQLKRSVFETSKLALKNKRPAGENLRAVRWTVVD